MGPAWTRSARRMGIVSSAAAVCLGVAYLVCLGIGLATLPSPRDPIADPWFTALELLILGYMPFLVTLMVSVHAWAGRDRRPHALSAVIFMALVAVITSGVHFSILTLGRADPFREMPWLFAFAWPSVVYALDILAWDVFFPLAVLFAVPVFRVGRLERWIRATLVVSGGLALAGLGGVFTGDMQIRNIGIVGYAVVFPVAALLLGVLFWRSRPPGEGGGARTGG